MFCMLAEYSFKEAFRKRFNFLGKYDILFVQNVSDTLFFIFVGLSKALPTQRVLLDAPELFFRRLEPLARISDSEKVIK